MKHESTEPDPDMVAMAMRRLGLTASAVRALFAPLSAEGRRLIAMGLVTPADLAPVSLSTTSERAALDSARRVAALNVRSKGDVNMRDIVVIKRADGTMEPVIDKATLKRAIDIACADIYEASPNAETTREQGRREVVKEIVAALSRGGVTAELRDDGLAYRVGARDDWRTA